MADDGDLPQELFFFLFLKHPTLEEKKAEGLEGSELNLHFPWNFVMSLNGHVTICQEQTTEYKAQLQICILVFGN